MKELWEFFLSLIGKDQPLLPHRQYPCVYCGTPKSFMQLCTCNHKVQENG